MIIRYTQEAIDNLEEIATYIAQKNPQAARNVSSAIAHSLTTIAAFPFCGRLQNVMGVRKLGVNKYPYFIYYYSDDGAEAIDVLKISHSARQRPYGDI